jgi:hypothetical protein
MAVYAPALFPELPVRRFAPDVGRGGGPPQRSGHEQLKASPREGRTLEDVLCGAWEDLTAHRTAACPICDGAMEPRYGAGPSAVGGRCRSCRTEIV